MFGLLRTLAGQIRNASSSRRFHVIMVFIVTWTFLVLQCLRHYVKSIPARRLRRVVASVPGLLRTSMFD